MSNIRFYNRPANRSFNILMDDLFQGMPSLFRDDHATRGNLVPVNIRENEAGYELQVIAPGFEKEHFSINLDNNILTISAETRKAESEEQKGKTVRSEYRFQGFKRSFTLDEQINAENIAASYTNGVLTLNLPKKAEVKPPVKQISIN